MLGLDSNTDAPLPDGSGKLYIEHGVRSVNEQMFRWELMDGQIMLTSRKVPFSY